MPINPVIPNRKTSEQILNVWNQQLRGEPIYQQFLRSQGIPEGAPVGLSRSQQGALEKHLAQNGITVPAGMHIDQAGNLNQKNRTGRNIAIGAGVAGAALTGVGLAGAGPLAGLGGAGGGAAAAGMPATIAGIPAGTTFGTAGALAGGAGATVAGGGAAAAGGGGLFSSLLKNAGTVGSLATGVAGGLQKGREGENAAAGQSANFNADQAAVAERALQDRAGLDLKQRQFTQDSQTDAYKKALHSALAMNMKDVVANRPKGIPNITFSGGARPSAIGPEGKAAGTELNRQSMLKLLNGEKFDAMPAYEKVAAPTYQKPGLFENIAGGVGMGLGAYTNAQAAGQQSDYQKKILQAIEELNKPQTSLGGGL